MKLTIPELSLIVLIGASGSGKSSFAAKHFLQAEVLSSDTFRALVSNYENDQTVSKEAFDALHFVASQRLKLGKLTVIDATNVQPDARKPLLELARRHDVLSVAIVLDIPERVCQQRNSGRPDRGFGPHVIRQQTAQLHRSLRGLGREGFRNVYTLRGAEQVGGVEIERQRLWTDRRDEHGPFDIIGDIHSCFDELVMLLEQLGYRVSENQASDFGFEVTGPTGRKAIFLGDLVDRGPGVVGVLRLVMSMVASGAGFAVPGNHESKLLRKLQGRDVQITHGLQETLKQLQAESQEFRDQIAHFLDGLISHYVLDDGRLVVAHAGMREELQGRSSSRVRDFALYGETTGETDEYGLPVRYNWAEEYRGKATVVYGHTPVLEPAWLNNTICLDTGCVFGGKLTALRYPERELVSVGAARVYYEPAKPLGARPSTAPEREAGLLDIDDVTGKRVVSTRLRSNITVREENAAAALEVMSRYAVDPRWLIYLPPTMSPCETSRLPEYLEHPTEAFDYFRRQGVHTVICEEKHMGSRAVVVICRSAEVAAQRFQTFAGQVGVVYTRTGRRFFSSPEMEAAFLDRLGLALDRAHFWERFETSWFCIDGEIMPWSLKAEDLLVRQYAPVASAARASLAGVLAALSASAVRGIELDGLDSSVAARLEAVEGYAAAYARYCWDATSIDDVRFAPFQLLAAEGQLLLERENAWHVEALAEIAEADGLVRKTEHRVVHLDDPTSEEAAIQWWADLTSAGGEGMVVKPLEGIEKGARGLVQPGVKCRGREYLRIIYGPEYTEAESLARLRKRGLSVKRSLAEREFALGVEALERFIRHEPLYRVHECVFGILALESEPVDPRL